MTQRRIASLTGWGRFMCHAEDLRNSMRRIEKIREKKNWGIAIEDDDWALVWQRLNFRLWRAHRAFHPIGCRTYSYTGDGPLSVSIAGIQVPGWVGKTEKEYANENAATFDKNYRRKAVRAKRLLTERHGPMGEHLTGLLDRHDYEETMRDAGGY